MCVSGDINSTRMLLNIRTCSWWRPWLKVKCFCLLQFGGKLVTFESPNVAPQQQPIPRQVRVCQVTTETEFLTRSAELQAALHSGSITSYCHGKISSAPCDAEQDIWRFLMVHTFPFTRHYNSLSCALPNPFGINTWTHLGFKNSLYTLMCLRVGEMNYTHTFTHLNTKNDWTFKFFINCCH